MTLYVNGRFLTQPLSGVQRYARELLGAFDTLLAQDPQPVEVLAPHPVTVPDWRVLRVRVVRGGQGHLWEQGALARAAQGGTLLSLGNSGPLWHRDHVLCLHDANLYEIPEAFAFRYRVAHRLLRPRLARRARLLLTVSRHSAQALSHHLGVPAARFHILSNSAEHVLRWPARADVPAQYGLTSGGYLLTVGNQSPNKNVAALIAAHGQAGEAVPPLVCVGGAVSGVAATGLGRSSRVRLLGRVPDADLRGLYEGAAGFVFPSLYEGFGIPPLEAMQLGVPVLCARSGAMPEVLGQGPQWFDPRDETDMVAALQRFARLSQTDREAMRVMGRAVAAQYRWRGTAERLQGVVLGHVQARPPSRASVV
ncbi:MAG: glycosyltransferase family 1 protein [Pseudomonadota bacterium]